MTSWVIFGTVSLTTVIVSMLPFAIPGMSKPDVFVRTNFRVGFSTLIE